MIKEKPNQPNQSKQKKLILATQNPGKVKEIKALVDSLKGKTSYTQVVSLKDLNDTTDVKETGTSFIENAKLKAQALYQKYNQPVLADDSGLECDDLKGAPGIYSARFAGLKATDQTNNQKLISELKKITNPTLKARYVCAMVLIDPLGKFHEVQKTCEGEITFIPKGNHGFGYDPYFYLPEYKKTMAELDPAFKNKISHRAKALLEIKNLLF